MRLTRARLEDLTDRGIAKWERDLETVARMIAAGELPATARPAAVTARTFIDIVNAPGMPAWLADGTTAAQRARAADATMRKIRAMLADGGRGLRFVAEYAAAVKKIREGLKSAS